MSSTERAPEPTMEEILASIRRIITDDEAGQANKEAQQTQPEDESLEGEADSQIINDIARVLSGSASQTPAEEEEEILDLTSELGGLEVVEEEVVEVAEVAEEAEFLDLEAAESAAPAQESMAEPTPEPAPGMEAEAPAEPAQPAPEMTPPPEMAAPGAPVPPQEPQAQEQEPQAQEFEAQAPVQPQEAQPQEQKPSASLEAASALERAIAALRAGQVPTSTTPQAEPFQFQAAPQPEPMREPTFVPEPPEETAEPEPEALPMAVPMEEPAPEAETHPEPEPVIGGPEAEAEAEAEAEGETGEAVAEPEQPEEELVLTEVEMTVAGEPEEAATLEAAEPGSESEKAPFWPSQPPAWQAEEAVEPEPAFEPGPEPEPAFEPEPAPEPVAAHANGAGAHHDEAGKSLEDSVKDMLRPMLQQWLDENMPRIVRELDPETLRRYQD